jgi:hypothetical protein
MRSSSHWPDDGQRQSRLADGKECYNLQRAPATTAVPACGRLQLALHLCEPAALRGSCQSHVARLTCALIPCSRTL